jgi:hypothetical protein
VTRDVEAGFDDDADEAAIKRALADAGFQNIKMPRMNPRTAAPCNRKRTRNND